MFQPDNDFNQYKSFNIVEIGKILNSLANEDAIKIFIIAREGIANSSSAIKKLNLTQKRYYARLKELVKVGLIEKRDNIYQFTTLGMICYNLVTIFNKLMVKHDLLDLADRLKRAKTISQEETKQILRAISIKGIMGSMGVEDIVQSVKMIDFYENFVMEIVTRIDNSEKNIYLVSYSVDKRVMEAGLRAIKRGVDFSLLTWEDNLSRLQMVKMILMSEITKTDLDLTSQGEVKVRYIEVPYSFCIVDEKIITIELPDPKTKIFCVGFSFQNEALCQKFIKTFEDYYGRGNNDAVSLLNHLGKGQNSIVKAESTNPVIY